MSWLKALVDDKHALEDVAFEIRRAGLEHLITNPDPDEIRALADAGDRLTQLRVAYLVHALGKPHEALRPFDGGATARQAMKLAAYAMSRALR